MKKITTLISSFVIAVASFGQVGEVAPDFTVKDISGNTYNLYELLDNGKLVILDASATWCEPCWGFHSEHHLQKIHDKYGPDGTNEVVVIFYEADASTKLTDLQGTGPLTVGDWLTGSTYPVINESPLKLSPTAYWPNGFPTINVIAPYDKKIKSDLWDIHRVGGTTEEMYASFEKHLKVFASIEEEKFSALNVYPNPATDNFTISYSAEKEGVATVQITDLLGKVIVTNTIASVVGINNSILDISKLGTGQYFVKIILNEKSENINFQVMK